MDFSYLTKQNIISYLAQRNYCSVNEQANITLFNEDVIGSEGYVNNVFRVVFKSKKQSFIIKQFLNYARDVSDVIGEKREFDPKRMYVEINAMQFMKKLIPDSLPEIYDVDHQYYIIIMEDLSGLKNIRYELAQGKRFLKFGCTIGIYLATWYFYTSKHFISMQTQKELLQTLNSLEQKQLLHALMFGKESPFSNTSNRPFEQKAKILHQIMQEDAQIQSVVEKYGLKFLNDTDCLAHGDFHLGNVLVNEDRVCIIDTEEGGYSNAAVDLGRILGSLILNYLSWVGRLDVQVCSRMDMQQYISNMIKDMYHSYEKTLELLSEHYDVKKHYQNSLQATINNSFKYAAIAFIGRLPSDSARPVDILSIPNKILLEKIQCVGLSLGMLLLKNDNVLTVDEFVKLLESLAKI